LAWGYDFPHREAQEEFDEKEALKLAKKLKKREFDLEDFLSQLRQLKKLGSLEQIMSMIPGMGQLKQLKNMKPDERNWSGSKPSSIL